MKYYCLLCLTLVLFTQCQTIGQDMTKEEVIKLIKPLIYEEDSDTDKALSILNNAMKTYPNDVDLHYYRGSTHVVKHVFENEEASFQLALDDLDKTLQIDSTHLNAYLEYIYIYEEKNNVELALEFATKAEKHHPNDLNLLRHKIQLYEDPKQIIIYATKILAIDSTIYSISAIRAGRYEELKEYDKAIADYTEAIKYGKLETNPRLLPLKDMNLKNNYTRRAEIFKKTGELSIALGEYQKLKDRYPARADYYQACINDVHFKMQGEYGGLIINPNDWLED